MQDFVEKFIKEKEAELAERCADAKSAVTGEREQEKEARLIRLGMCEKQYSDMLNYSAEYPYQEYKTGKYYRLVPFTVSDEEYAAICCYDNATRRLKPTSVSEKYLGKSAKGLRRIALASLIFGGLVSILVGIMLYLADSQYLLASLAIAVFGSVFSWFSAVQFYATAKTLEHTGYLLAREEEKK